MAEFTAIAPQTVAANANVLLTETPVRGNPCILHREGSGIVTLRGQTNQCRALYRVGFGANVAIPTGGTVAPIALAITLDGEPLGSATVISTPTAAAAFNSVYMETYIEVPRGCCKTVAVRNIGTDAVDVANANLIVTRDA